MECTGSVPGDLPGSLVDEKRGPKRQEFKRCEGMVSCTALKSAEVPLAALAAEDVQQVIVKAFLKKGTSETLDLDKEDDARQVGLLWYKVETIYAGNLNPRSFKINFYMRKGGNRTFLETYLTSLQQRLEKTPLELLFHAIELSRKMED